MATFSRRAMFGMAGAVGVGGVIAGQPTAAADPGDPTATDGLPSIFSSPTPQTTSAALVPGQFNWFDATAGAVTPTLPPAASVSAGVSVAVEKADASLNSVVVTCTGTDHLDSTNGPTTAILTTPGEKAYFASDGLGLWMRTGGQLTRAAADARYLTTADIGRFGADPTGATDSTAAIQAAVASLSAKGGIVHVPPGTFTVSSTIVVPGGVLLQGTSTDLGADGTAPGAGSIIQAGAGFPTDGVSPVVQLGADAAAFVTGATGASADHMIIDAANIAAVGLKTLGRRCVVSYCQAYRATVTSMLVSGQNSVVTLSWFSGANVCQPLKITGSDVKILECQIRQAGPGLPQVWLTGNDVSMQFCHVYGGANGTVAGTGPGDDILVQPGGNDVGRYAIVGNILDGTNGHTIRAVVNGASRGRGLVITGNVIFSVTGMTTAQFYPLFIDASACTFISAWREIVFTGNTFSNVVAGGSMWRAMVGFLTKATSGATVERFVVDDNMGANAPRFFEGLVAKRSDTGCAVTTGSASVTDPSIQASDAGQPVYGPGVPPGAYVGPAAQVTAGSGFRLSSSPTSQVDLAAVATSAAATLAVGQTGSAWRPDFLGENNGLFVANATPARSGNRGQSVFSGTGSQTAFAIPHGLGFTPSWNSITPGSAAAAAPCFVTASATALTVTFLSAPPAGTGNLVVNWRTAV